MVEYKCHKCNKIYKHKGEYERHINKKNPCDLKLPHNIQYQQDAANVQTKQIDAAKIQEIVRFEINTNNHQCSYCNKSFTRKSSLNVHINDRCKNKKKDDSEKDILIKKLLAEFEEFKKKSDEKIDVVVMQNQKLREEVEQLKLNKPPTINNADKMQIVDKQQINNNNNNIKLIAFGKEDLSYISETVTNEILKRGFNCVPKLIEHVHFNKDKPEYHNVYIPNRRNGEALIFNGADWEIENNSEVLDVLKANSCEFIDAKFKEFKEKGSLDAPSLKKMNRFISERDEEEKSSSIDKEVLKLLYTKRNTVTGTISKIKKQKKAEEKLLER
jgi:hypothetical protein